MIELSTKGTYELINLQPKKLNEFKSYEIIYTVSNRNITVTYLPATDTLYIKPTLEQLDLVILTGNSENIIRCARQNGNEKLILVPLQWFIDYCYSPIDLYNDIRKVVTPMLKLAPNGPKRKGKGN